jgi:CRP-like cAMP-binding protein
MVANQSDSFAVGLPFSEHRQSIVSLIAVDPTDVLFLHRSDLMSLFSENHMILNNYLESMVNGLYIFHHRIRLLTLNSIRQKVSFYLLNELQEQGGTTIKLRFSKRSLAEYMNIPSPSLSRELHKMSAEGLIHVDKNLIELFDIEKLREVIS